MKLRTKENTMKIGNLLALGALLLGIQWAGAQGTGFTYQGRLLVNGSAANGSNDFQFRIYTDPAIGGSVGPVLTKTNVIVTDGLVNLELDFGANVFTGGDRWLQISHRSTPPIILPPPVPPPPPPPYTNMFPRVRLTPAPYAIFAGSAATVASNGVTTLSLQDNSITASKISTGNVVKWLNGLTDFVNLAAGSNVTVTTTASNIVISAIGGGSANNTWLLAGNGGTTAGPNYLGTTDNQPLELKVSGARVLRLEPTAGGAGWPNVIAGAPDNQAIGAYGANIGGGAANTNSAGVAAIGGGWRNFVGPGGGGSVIAGGEENRVVPPDFLTRSWSVVGGGWKNTNSGMATIAGGTMNFIGTNADNAVIGGGRSQVINHHGVSDTIAGGEFNTMADSTYGDTISGGRYNTVGTHTTDAVISGGLHNTISSNSENAVISGGWNNLVNDYCDHAIIAGGRANTISNSHYATISGGQMNSLDRQADQSNIGGGQRNAIGHYSFDANISGGYFNSIGEFAQRSSIGGGSANQILFNASNSHIGGGSLNAVAGQFAVIAGGSRNEASKEYAAVLGGSNNIAGAVLSTVVGGGSNHAIGNYSAVVGGLRNEARGEGSFIGGGGGAASPSVVYGDFSAILGGWDMMVSGRSAVAVGGGNQMAVGDHSMVLGGRWNAAYGNFSFASGTAAKAEHLGAFVWADSAQGMTNILGTNYALWPLEFRSTNPNEFAVRATGGARFVSGVETNGNPKFGVVLYPNATSWASISDRNAKTDFQPVDSRAVLEKLAQVPVQRWHYKGEGDQASPHLGPMAQDFKAAFYPGRDDKTITTLEFDGVELAAIQGLNQKLEAEARNKDARIGALEESVAELKVMLGKLASQHNGGTR